MKLLDVFYSFIFILVLSMSTVQTQAASVCGVDIPGTYHESGHDQEFEVEVFKKMPHFQYYLKSDSHPISLIVGEKILDPENTKAINKKTIDQWAQAHLNTTLDIFSQTRFQSKSIESFLNEVAGFKMSLSYDNQYEKRLFIIKSLDCAVEFIALSSEKNKVLVNQTINHFLSTLRRSQQSFWIIPNSYWYMDLGPTNQIALTILMIMIAISFGLIFYVRKREL